MAKKRNAKKKTTKKKKPTAVKPSTSIDLPVMVKVGQEVAPNLVDETAIHRTSITVSGGTVTINQNATGPVSLDGSAAKTLAKHGTSLK